MPRLLSEAFYKWTPIFTCAQTYNKSYRASRFSWKVGWIARGWGLQMGDRLGQLGYLVSQSLLVPEHFG